MDFFPLFTSFNRHKKTIMQNQKEETGGAYRTPASINKPEKNYETDFDYAQQVWPRSGYLL